MSAIARSVAAQLRRGLIAVLLAGAWCHCWAEVSVAVDPLTGQSAGGSIYLSAIVDSPDPILGIWTRYGQSPFTAVLNESGDSRGDGPPAVLGNPAGLCAVAWAKHNPAGFDVVMSRFVQGAWTAEEVLAGGASDELDPVLFSAPDGTVHLFYWEAGPTPRVLSRVATADLSSWGPVTQVSEEGVASVRPSAVIHEGALWIAYEVHDHGLDHSPRQIVTARLEDGQWLREVVGVSWAEEPLRPEIHSRSGKLWVDWIDAPGQMLWLRREGASSWTSIQSLQYSNVLERDFFTRGSIKKLAIE